MQFKKTEAISREILIQKVLSKERIHLISLNEQILREGAEFAS